MNAVSIAREDCADQRLQERGARGVGTISHRLARTVGLEQVAAGIDALHRNAPPPAGARSPGRDGEPESRLTKEVRAFS